MALLLSVLDQTPIPAGDDAATALANTLDLARACDRFGFHRYWLAEHHATPSLAGAAPEALIGPIALATPRIRVGSGGIMLPHYSPFKVAETFAMLAALAPGRIDLGVGRAPGSDQRTAVALQRERDHRVLPNDFPGQLAELIAYLGPDGFPEEHAFAHLRETLPRNPGGPPALWLLGSSPDSARWAAEAGLPYCFADFINSDGAALAHDYRRRFVPSASLARPHVIVSSWAIAAATRAQAERLAAPAAMMFAHMMRGQLIAVPSIADALAWAEANPGAQRRGRRSILGDPAEVRAAVEAVAAEYGADEAMLVNIMPDHAARVESYRLVAEAFGLAPAAIAA